MTNHFGSGFKKFDSTYSIIEKIFTIIAITTGATVTVWLSKAEPYLARLGALGYLLIFTFVVTLFFIVKLLHRSSVSKKAEGDYFSRLTVSPSEINPLDESFEKKVIKLEDLRLPVNRSHENKTFRKCTFVGPMAILIGGNGGISNSKFTLCGELMVLPETIGGIYLNGVMKFINCTFYDCEFIQATIIVNRHAAEKFRADMPGMKFIGL